MPEETKSKRKKKRKFGYYLYAVVIIVLTIVNITLATMLLTHVQEIKVVGNQLSDKQDVIAWIQEDKLTRNSLYTYFKFKAGVRKLPVYLEDVKVQLSAPWEVEVTVTEKKIIGSTILDEIYVYFDEEGLILKKVNEYDTTIPIIEGIEMKNAEVFEYMNVENEKVFSYIVKVTQEIQKKELHPDHIVWEDDSMNLYFEGVCVKLGKSNFATKIAELPPILEELEGKEGTLHMEHYTSGRISFRENGNEEIVEE